MTAALAKLAELLATLADFFAKLADYFRYVGMASIVAWMLAAALVLLFLLGWRRSKVCWTALVAAIVGLVLANVNSNFISAIKIDFSEQLQQAKQRAAEETTEDDQPRESDVSEEAEKAKRAEAAEREPLDDESPAEAAENEPRDDKSPAESAEKEPQGAEPGPDYRRQGKIQREEGMELEEKIPIGPGTEEQPVEKNVRVMKMHQVMHANRLDRLNLLLARWTFYLAVLLVVVDYFRRFNKTFESYLPLPFAGRLVDSLFPKSHTVCARADDERPWKRFLQRTVRKGETFIYFCRQDPWPEPALGRLPRFVPVRWRLEKIACALGGDEFDDEFLFESAWFGRYCFVLLGDGPAAVGRLDALADFLELRRQTRASAAHTVNVLWDLYAPLPSRTLDRLLPLCRETNFKLILATSAPPGEELAARFEDVVG